MWNITRILLLLLFSASTLAESYIREYTYKASEADSKLSSRTIALDQVKVLLLQEIGTHIRQKINITKESSGNAYASEDVEAITAGLTKVDILEEKWDGATYYLKARLEADTNRVLNALEEFKKSNSNEIHQQLEALKANVQALQASREEVVRLRRSLSDAKTEADINRIINNYNIEIDKITSGEFFNKGFELLQDGKYEQALYHFLIVAEHGYVGAQFNVGLMYENGYGVKQDYYKAFYWYKKAADKGDSSSQNSIGVMYVNGQGVEQSYVDALYWFRKAADQQYALAQNNLGYMYINGLGTKKDFNEALYWYKKGSDSGSVSAKRWIETFKE